MNRQFSFFLFSLIALLFLSACSDQQEAVDDVFDYKHSFIGDNSAVVKILNALPYHESLQEVALHTKEEPYGMTVKYNQLQGDPQKIAVQNSAYLFTLIDNADWITFNFDGEKVELTRQEAEKLTGVNFASVTKEELSKAVENKTH